MDPELVRWIPLVQIVTNATLTIVAICIAIASLVVAYRNNFGWKPVALIGSIGIKGKAGSKDYTAVITLEVWNRYKYPISIRHMNIDFKELQTRPPQSWSRDDAWYIGSGHVAHFTAHTLGPSTHEEHEILVPFTADSLDRLNAPMHIRIFYFDPRRNAKKIIEFNHVYRLSSDEKRLFA